jgi:DNA-directed RNA polymerase specialized sigma subunit
MTIYNRWKKKKKDSDFQKLYVHFKPDLDKAIFKAAAGSNLPQPAHKLFAAQNFLRALETYQPGKGATLRTHVNNSVKQKAKRLNYTYQNLGFATETRSSKIGLYQTELENMKLVLGREPSAAELADRLNMNPREIEHLRKETAKDLGFAGGVEEKAVFETSRDEELLGYLYYELNPEQQMLYDYMFGKHGKQRMVKPNNTIEFDKISRVAGMSVSKLRSLHKQIQKKQEDVWKRH